ncbi:MAG TPA: TRAP transporter substrate-binding protein DctP [Geminicoccaceae bacterium]
MISRKLGAGALAAAVASGGLGPASAQETLRALSMQPAAVTYTQSFLKFIDKVNAAGQGVVQIEFVGGPEAIPTFDQPEAVREGVIDMIYGPGSYYAGIVPETDALVGSNVTPMEKRANGGIDLLNQIHQEKMNVYYLGHPDGGIQFHVYMTKEPRLKDDGLPDMSGIKLRGAPIYREFFTNYLGATFVQVNVPEVYTALERGTVDGLGWPSIGVMDLSWDNFLKYRIDPGYFQTDLSILVNLDRWNALSEEAKQLLQDTAIAWEEESYEQLQALRAEEDAEMKKRGMQVVELPPEAAEAYLAAAYEEAWNRLKERDPTHYDELRTKFFQED